MLIKSDLHTHTIYSDGKSTIEQNVIAARKKGLKRIAITDHGPNHKGFGIKRNGLKHMRDIVDEMNLKYDDIQILLGIEANILNENGDIDVYDDMKQYLDIILAGYHFGSFSGNLLADVVFHGNNLLKNKSKKIYEKAKRINTNAFVNAMKRHDIDIITHPGAKGPLDMHVVAKVAKQTNTALEISASRHKYLTFEDILIAKQYDVDFTINSDAHITSNIGGLDGGIKRALDAGINIETIVNNRFDFPNRG